MPPARGTLSVAVVNDTLYALGGTNNLLNPQAPTDAVNEQYFPIGYGEPASSPSKNPTISPSTPQSTIIYYMITAVVLIIILMAIVITLFLRKRHSTVRARSKET